MKLQLWAFNTERWTKGIDIRKVMSVSDIVTLLSLDFVKLVLVAILYWWG